MEKIDYNDHWHFMQDVRNEWRWKRTSGNHKIVGASTEGYKNKKDCIDNAIRNGYDVEKDAGVTTWVANL